MLSTRFTTPVLALLALAAIPTVIHSYVGSSVSDGRTAQAIPMRLAGELGSATTRRAGWGEDRFSASDWIERRYGGAQKVTLFVGRSLDPKRLYHHPELAVEYGQSYVPSTIIRLPQRAEVPVHLLTGTKAESRRIALYTLYYEDSYVADPIRFQLRQSFQLLFSRRAPMTLFFVAQDLVGEEHPESSLAAGVLLSAMAAFEKQRQ